MATAAHLTEQVSLHRNVLGEPNVTATPTRSPLPDPLPEEKLRAVNK